MNKTDRVISAHLDQVEAGNPKPNLTRPPEQEVYIVGYDEEVFRAAKALADYGAINFEHSLQVGKVSTLKFRCHHKPNWNYILRKKGIKTRNEMPKADVFDCAKIAAIAEGTPHVHYPATDERSEPNVHGEPGSSLENISGADLQRNEASERETQSSYIKSEESS